jgi:hypothetical protein
MPSTYSNLGIELIASGDQAGTWGTTTNTNLGTLIDQAISGYATYACTGTPDTITIPNGATGVARNMYLKLTGTGGSTLTVPTNTKLYFIFNSTASAITVKTSGAGVSVPAGAKTVLLCDGTDIVVAENYLASLTVGGALGVTGATTLSSTLAVTGNATVGGTLGVTGITTVAAGSAALPAIVSTTGTADTGLWFPAADTVAASTGGTERIRINSTGNLGIGLTSYSLPLSVVANSNGQNVQLNGRTGDSLVQMFFRDFGGANNLASITSDSSGHLYFGAGSQTIPNVPTERMRIDASGNVGIGTTSPSTYGKLAVSVGNNSFMGATTSSGAGGGWQLNTYYLAVKTNYIDCEVTVGTPASESSVMRFATIGSGTLAEAMRIDPSGNLLVGTTSVYSNAKLVIDSKTASYPALAAYKTVTGDTSNPAIVVSKFDNDGSTSQVLMQFLYNNGSSGLGQINGNGGGSAAFGSYSDIRLKENVADLPSQLNNIMSLRPVEFDWRDGSGHQIGFIAQEVNEVYPDIVGENSDGMLTLTDMNKNDARLIKCIQEQQALILALTARITALENK